ncbi:hypothetical protein E2562_007098 [Oryza meyeriana var. granulata]|uniref:Uncharacterized protein n=1 Tax=Oryza meyeriana var. granulata TaxID=110450 RepID=A0A6G1F4Z1_9ORYZ|nr:hypothetical protein E2562_007098 [Oryza meyeriana var. granulata]
MMKSKASTFLKQMLSTIVAVVKAKSTAVRAKTSAMKTRLLIFGILRNRKLLVSAINHKIHAIMGGQDSSSSSNKNSVANFTSNGGGGGGGGEEEDGGSKKAVVLYSTPSFLTERGYAAAGEEVEEEDSDDYLTHSLFQEDDDDDDELVNAPGSVIDLVRDAKEGEGGEFRLEDEIDHVADVFIRRIHKQLKLQKLDSFKRFCEMLERSA